LRKINGKVQKGLWIPAFAGKTVKPQPIFTMPSDYRRNNPSAVRGEPVGPLADGPSTSSGRTQYL